MERRRKAVFCSLAVLVLAAAVCQVFVRPDSAAPSRPVRLGAPAAAHWMV